MTDFRDRFLQLAASAGALGFGSFTLKSGRVSPYFFNAGKFRTGAQLGQLGECYADAWLASGLSCDMLFGPAYKGIPLATTAAVALARRGHDLPLAFNRKEAKDHGEGGMLIGAPLAGRVLIIDDVITAGTAIRESLAMIRAAGATPCGVLIALDRQERGQGERSAAQELSEREAIPVLSIAGLADVLSYTENQPAFANYRQALVDYRQQYGVAAT